MSAMREDMLLRILTPRGVTAEVACDSVNVMAADGKNGRGGGSTGILRGHAEAVIALQKGVVCAKKAGETVFSAELGGGFASVRHNIVTIITDME